MKICNPCTRVLGALSNQPTRRPRFHSSIIRDSYRDHREESLRFENAVLPALEKDPKNLVGDEDCLKRRETNPPRQENSSEAFVSTAGDEVADAEMKEADSSKKEPFSSSLTSHPPSYDTSDANLILRAWQDHSRMNPEDIDFQAPDVNGDDKDTDKFFEDSGDPAGVSVTTAPVKFTCSSKEQPNDLSYAGVSVVQNRSVVTGQEEKNDEDDIVVAPTRKEDTSTRRTKDKPLNDALIKTGVGGLCSYITVLFFWKQQHSVIHL